VKASFFLTGRFYENHSFKDLISELKQKGHYLGPHSQNHLLYCDWNKRDSLLVTEEEFANDLRQNLEAMEKFGIAFGRRRLAEGDARETVRYFIPPFEWYNHTISNWTKKKGLQLISFSPGTKSTADYTTPAMKNYLSSEKIWQSIVDFEMKNANGMNGFILLLHIGTDPARTDKFYKRLPQLISLLKQKGYHFVKVDELLKE